MKKSLNVGVFDPNLIMQASPYCGDEVFAKGLEANGYEVTRFDYRATNSPNTGLLELADKIRPDLFWFGKCERIDSTTIRELKSQFPEACFVKWAADVRIFPTSHDLEHNQHIDWFFGTFGGDYLKAHLTTKMKGACSILTFTDSDFYKTMPVKDEWKSDVLWTGRPGFGDNLLRNEVMFELQLLQIEHDVRIHTPYNWIGNPEYLYAINGTKIGVGSNSFNRRLYSSDRLGNYMACGAFYLTQYIEGIEKCFKRGKHLDWFESIEEMEEKIKYYLEHDEERIKIAKAGKEFVLKHFDYKPLVKNLLNVIKTGKSKYEWDEIYTNNE